MDDSQSTAAWTSGMVESQSSAWTSTVAALAERGLELRDILALHAHLLEEKTFYAPVSSTTKDVVFHAVIPMTQERLCSYATLVNDGEPKRAQRFITHIWGNVFTHTVAAMVADVLGMPVYERIAQHLTTVEGTMAVLDKVRRAGRADTVFWVCCFSINQHKSICNRAGTSRGSAAQYPVCGCLLEKFTSGDLSEMNKFADMMVSLHSAHGLTQVIALDADFQLFTRAWCVAELVEARRQGMPQKLILHRSAAVENRREQLLKLTVRECQASEPQDLEEIMRSIEDIDAFDAHLRELLLNQSTGLLTSWQKAIHSYLFRWDEFSPGYVKQLVDASQGPVWRIPLVALGPVAICAPAFAFLPYPEPGSPNEAYYVMFGWFPPLFIVCYCGLVVLVASLAQLQWQQLNPVIVTSAVVLSMTAQSLAVFVAYLVLGESWPVPWACALCTPVCSIFVGYLWWSIPRGLRNDPAWRRRCGMAIAAVCFILGLWVVTGPLICAVMSLSESFWIHSLLAAALLSQKLACERAVTVVMKSLTADVLPIFVFACSSCYESLLCTALSRVGAQVGNGWQNWCLFVELAGFDVIENCFHLWTLARQGDAGCASTLPTKSQTPQDARPQATEMRPTVSWNSEGRSDEGRDQLIISQLVLREYQELCAPVKFQLVLAGLYMGNREQSDLVCQWTDSDFVAVSKMVVLDFIVELVVTLATWRVLQRRGKTPWRTLAGLVKQHFWCFFMWDFFNICVRILEQSRMTGSDYTFQFKWMRDEEAGWDCGLRWMDH